MIAVLIAGYLLFLGIFSVYSYWALNHLKTYGYFGDSTKLTSNIYLVLSVINISVTVIILLILGVGI